MNSRLSRSTRIIKLAQMQTIQNVFSAKEDEFSDDEFDDFNLSDEDNYVPSSESDDSYGSNEDSHNDDDVLNHESASEKDAESPHIFLRKEVRSCFIRDRSLEEKLTVFETNDVIYNVPAETCNNLFGKYSLREKDVQQLKEIFRGKKGTWKGNEDTQRLEENLSGGVESLGKGNQELPQVEENLHEEAEAPAKKSFSGEAEATFNKRKTIYESPFLLEARYKKTYCIYCDSEVDSKHFSRHLTRNHREEKEVKAAMELPKGKRKNEQIALIRSSGNMEAGLRGHIIPKRRDKKREINAQTHTLCRHCKAFIKKTYITTHCKTCFANRDTDQKNSLIDSIIYVACHKKYGKILDSLELKNRVLTKMRPDEEAEDLMEDLLIVSWGDDLLKKTPTGRSTYHLNTKMRLCMRFVKSMRLINPEKYTDMLSCLKPEALDDVVEACKKIAKYDATERTFKAGSNALHFGTYLKQIADLTMKIMMRKKIDIPEENFENRLKQLKRFKLLIHTQWTNEVASLAKKDLQQKAGERPLLIPLTEDIIKLKKLLEKTALEAYQRFQKHKNPEDFKILCETTLASIIIHNRKRGGDIQYITLKKWEIQMGRGVEPNQEFLQSLTESEKILLQNYVRIESDGKWGRNVPVLIPKSPTLQYMQTIVAARKNQPNWFMPSNQYVFCFPKSARWMDGASIIRKYGLKCGAKKPSLLTTNLMRKHIATTTQVLSLKPNEVDQLAQFMGHTTRTHEQFYKLPNDVYQCAKVSKILQLMESGSAAQYKNKSLEEIDINMNEVLEEEPDSRANDDEGLDEELEARDDGESEDSQTNDDPERVDFSRSRNTTNVNNDDEPIRKRRKTEVIKGARKRWDAAHKNLVLRVFRKNINERQFPHKDAIMNFIKKYPKEFSNDDYKRIRTLIVNSYSLKK